MELSVFLKTFFSRPLLFPKDTENFDRLSICQESELVPYAPSSIPCGPYLIFAPHPDDESMGMGGTILLAASSGINVHLVIVTDGSLGGKTEIRKIEVQKAAHILGIKTIDFLEIKDRDVANEGISLNSVTMLTEKYKPKTVFLPSLLEFHPDHRATTASVLKNLTSLSDLSAEVWLYEISRQGEVNRLIDITNVAEGKKQAIRCYESQISQVAYDDVAFAINKARAYTLGANVQYAEGFWATSCITKPEELRTAWKEKINTYWTGIR